MDLSKLSIEIHSIFLNIASSELLTAVNFSMTCILAKIEFNKYFSKEPRETIVFDEKRSVLLTEKGLIAFKDVILKTKVGRYVSSIFKNNVILKFPEV